MLLYFFFHLAQCKRYWFTFHWELLTAVGCICILSLEMPAQDKQRDKLTEVYLVLCLSEGLNN